MSVFGQRWACPERARDNYARVVSTEPEVTPEEKNGNYTHIKVRSKHSSLTATKNQLGLI